VYGPDQVGFTLFFSQDGFRGGAVFLGTVKQVVIVRFQGGVVPFKAAFPFSFPVQAGIDGDFS
jgi:hypothetical protein